MPTQRERTWTLLFIAACILTASVLLSLLAEAFFLGRWFYTISTLIYVSGAVISLSTVALLVFNYSRAYWLESQVTANMFSVGPDDRIIENWRLGETIVRSPVVGVTTQMLTIAPTEQAMPLVRQMPLYLTHIAGELPVIENLSQEAYQQFVEMLHKKVKEDQQ